MDAQGLWRLIGEGIAGKPPWYGQAFERPSDGPGVAGRTIVNGWYAKEDPRKLGFRRIRSDMDRRASPRY